jgi:putative peptide-modifying radical SAM enzyme
VLLILLTTGQCNLRCYYCGGSFSPDSVPWKVEYELEDLIKYMSHYVDLDVAFYGGEPLLNPKFIMYIMDKVKARHFIIQTNGLLIELLPPSYWNRFDSVLISIDGPRWLTDKHRGEGVHDKVLKNSRKLRERGFRGDLIARMTVTEGSDIYRDVTYLLGLGLFDHVHWQLDFIWSDRWKDVKGWVKSSYKPGLRKLVELWVENLRRGKVLGIAPFQGIVKRIREGGPRPPCGSGTSSLSISTDGRVLACPIAVNEGWAELGYLKDFKGMRELIEEPCTSCEYFRVCGGRCLYAYMERLWGEEGFNMTCEVTKYLIDLLYGKVHVIERLVEEGVIEWREICYPPFNNTVEVIP